MLYCGSIMNRAEFFARSTKAAVDLGVTTYDHTLKCMRF